MASYSALQGPKRGALRGRGTKSKTHPLQHPSLLDSHCAPIPPAPHPTPPHAVAFHLPAGSGPWLLYFCAPECLVCRVDSRPCEGAQSQKLRAAVPEPGLVWESPLVLDNQAAPGDSDSESLGWAPLLGLFAARLRSHVDAWLGLGLTAGEPFQAPVSTPNFTPLPRVSTPDSTWTFSGWSSPPSLGDRPLWLPSGGLGSVLRNCLASSRFPDLFPQDVGRYLLPHLHWVSLLFLLLQSGLSQADSFIADLMFLIKLKAWDRVVGVGGGWR